MVAPNCNSDTASDLYEAGFELDPVLSSSSEGSFVYSFYLNLNIRLPNPSTIDVYRFRREFRDS